MKYSIVILSIVVAAPLVAQTSKPDTAVKIEGVKILAEPAPAKATPVQTLTLPAIATITARKVEETVNLIDT
jgi:hypothetical protein